MSTRAPSATAHLSATLSHVSLAVPNPAAVVRFYRDVVGLQPENPGRSTAQGSRLGTGVGLHAIEVVEGRGLDHFGLELVDEGAVEALGNRIAVQGVEVAAIAEQEDHPTGLVVADPDGNRIELHGPVDRSGEHVADPGRRPVRIHHVTLGTSDVHAMVEFYVSVLGFRVSDRMGDVFVWLRSSREHHSVAVVDASEPGLDHYAYEIADWASLKTWCDELAIRNVPITWGPGRHGPGNNLFVMFDDPATNRIELSCEMERYWDDAAEYTPRVWRSEPKTINLWGVGPSWRERVAP